MADFTRGPVEVVSEWKEELGVDHIWIGPKDWHTRICRVVTYQGEVDQQYANASLIAAAFNSATKVEEMNFDGQKAIEELPNMVGALLECEVLLDNHPLIRRMVKDILIKVKEKDNG